MKSLVKVLSIAVTTLFMVVNVYALPNGVITTTANIGGKSAQLVYIDMSSPKRKAEAVLANQLVPDKPENMIKEVKDGDVVASMNGGFFNAYAKGDIKFPDNYYKIYGTVISNGKVVNNGNVNAPALVFDVNGKPYIGTTHVNTYCSINGEISSCGDVNSGGSWYNDAMKANVYVSQGSKVAYVKNEIVTGVVESSGANIKIPADTTVLINNDRVKQGDRVKILYEVKVNGELINADTVITCGPLILDNGVNTSANLNGSYDSKQGSDVVAQRSFAAVAPDGRLILGTAVNSPNKIAEYLKSVGVKNAMLFDGGASSMMYVTGKGFMTKAGRNLAGIFMVVDKYNTDNKIWAVPSSANVSVNSQNVSINAYTIDNNNYFKLRDIAYILKNTGSAFDVGWDSATNTILINSVNAGKYSGNKDYNNFNLISDAEKSSANIIINGKNVNLEAYKINGSNYFKLRDVAEQINAQIQWENSTSTINIVTN